MFLGQLGCVKDVFDNFKASKRIFWRVCALWRLHWVDQHQSLTGSVVITLDWRYENVDFGASKMKSRYDSRIVTRMFLGQSGYAKHVFDNFEASKRIFWRVCASWKPIIQGKTIPLQGLWPTIPFDGLKMSIFGASKMKSRYDSRIVTTMFLGQLRYLKLVFNNFEASKRILSTSLHVMKTNYLGETMPLEGLWPSMWIGGLKM